MLAKIILALVALAVAASSLAIAKNGVPLFDKPGPAKRLLAYLSRNTAETRPDHERPELRTRTYALAPGDLLDRVERAVGELGWETSQVDEARGTLHAVVATPWLGFKDDVRIDLVAADGGGTVLHVASRSRVGRADYGANTAHIMALHAALDRITG